MPVTESGLGKKRTEHAIYESRDTCHKGQKGIPCLVVAMFDNFPHTTKKLLFNFSA